MSSMSLDKKFPAKESLVRRPVKSTDDIQPTAQVCEQIKGMIDLTCWTKMYFLRPILPAIVWYNFLKLFIILDT
jgi:hypothetical protein